MSDLVFGSTSGVAGDGRVAPMLVDSSGRMVPSNVVSEWRTSFATVLAGADPLFWTTMCKGAGQTVNQAGGNLVVTAGVAVNEETILRSTASFASANFRLSAMVQLSQRNANNTFAVELVDIVGDALACVSTAANNLNVTFPAGKNPFSAGNIGQFVSVGVIAGLAGVPGRVAINAVAGDTVSLTTAGWPGGNAAGTVSLYGWNYHKIEFTGAVATTANFQTQRKGWADVATAATVNTTATGTAVIETLEDSEATLLDRLQASLSVPTPRASRFTNVPDPGTVFALQIRCTNNTAAPTATTLTMAMVCMQTYTSLPVSIETSRPQGAANQLPVNVAGGTLPAVTTVATVTTLTGGSTAEDAATATNPHIIGGVVRTATAPVTLVAGDAARATMTSGAALVVKNYAVPDVDWVFTSAITGLATAADTAAKSAGAASIRNYVTGLQIQNNSATASEFQIKDGATVIWRCMCPANMPVTAIDFPTPLRGTAATVLNVQAVTAASVVIANLEGYQST